MANHKLATEQDKQNALKVISYLETIDQPDTYNENWFVNLSLHYDNNRVIPDKEYVVVRNWWLYFENNTLSIEVETCHSSDPTDHYGDDFSYYATIYLQKMDNMEQFYITETIDHFVEDAANYSNHITETLNEVEVEIDL